MFRERAELKPVREAVEQVGHMAEQPAEAVEPSDTQRVSRGAGLQVRPLVLWRIRMVQCRPGSYPAHGSALRAARGQALYWSSSSLAMTTAVDGHRSRLP